MIEFTASVSDTDSGWDKLAKTLKGMSSKTVKVGIQASEDSELLTIANANEFGADIDHPGGTPYIIVKGGKARFVKKGTPNIVGITKPHKIIIPSRPFIRGTFDKRIKELQEIGVDLGGLVIDDKLLLKQALETWGDKFVAFIRNEIAEGNNFEPNAPATIRMKGGGKHPLQDSGRLQQALKAVIFGRRELEV